MQLACFKGNMQTINLKWRMKMANRFDTLRLKRDAFGLTSDEYEELELLYEQLGDPDEASEFDDYSRLYVV